MVRITEDLVRKRAEHNEMQISTLEEISLHQQDIERLENLDKWCRDLKILYLQSNLIPKIENVGRLKKLEYLNLALNNIEKVENLEGCESLKKLDLTVNFVGELTSIECLKNLYSFKELFLTGNPCSDFEHYREYVIATLPQLQRLDGIDIEKSERITATQNLPYIRGSILEQQERYKQKRAKEKAEAMKKTDTEKLENDISGESYNADNVRSEQKGGDSFCNGSNEENKEGFNRRWYTDVNKAESNITDNTADCKENYESLHKEQVDNFWNQKTGYTPESRLEVHNYMKELKKKEEPNRSESEPKTPRRLFMDDGRPLNVNEPKVDFSLTEDNHSVILDVAVFKFMDTSLIDCDVQPTYVRVTLKGKILQLTLPAEVISDKSLAQRSQTTGHLVVTMPKVTESSFLEQALEVKSKKPQKLIEKPVKKTHESYLEVDPDARKQVDITNIVPERETQKTCSSPCGSHAISRKKVQDRPNSEEFVDDPSVPALL